jgi:hypothetical protein
MIFIPIKEKAIEVTGKTLHPAGGVQILTKFDKPKTTFS